MNTRPTGQHQTVALPPRPIRPWRVAAAAGAAVAFGVGVTPSLALHHAGGLSAVALVVALLPIAIVAAAYAELASTYPSREGTLAAMARAFSPRFAALGSLALLVALVAVAGAAIVDVVTLATALIAPGGSGPAMAHTSTPLSAPWAIAATLVVAAVATGASVIGEPERTRIADIASKLLLGVVVTLIVVALGVGWASERFRGAVSDAAQIPLFRGLGVVAMCAVAPLALFEGGALAALGSGRPAFVAPRGLFATGLALMILPLGAVIAVAGAVPSSGSGLPAIAMHLVGPVGERVTTVTLILVELWVAIAALRLTVAIPAAFAERGWTAGRPLPALAIAALIALVAATTLALGDARRATRALVAAAVVAGAVAHTLQLVAVWRLRRADSAVQRQFRLAPALGGRPVLVPVGIVFLLLTAVIAALLAPVGAILAVVWLGVFYGVVRPGRLSAGDRNLENAYYDLLQRAGEPELASQYRSKLERGTSS